MAKRYIGNGIYAEIYANARIRLTAEYGSDVTNEIWMDHQEYTVFAEFVAEVYRDWLKGRGLEPDTQTPGGPDKLRQRAEHLLHHLKDDQCRDTPEGRATGIKILEWLLGPPLA